jgi:glycosyltransferase involved in cell wall biosynthesis
MRPVLLFADRLPPLIGGMETHARYFIEYFRLHPRFPLLGVVTRDQAGQDWLLRGGDREAICVEELDARLAQVPSIVFFNSGRWIEDLAPIRTAFPAALLAYRTGGNEIVKAPLERARIEQHAVRQQFWAERINEFIDVLITNSAFTESRLRALGLSSERFLRCVGGVNAGALRDALSRRRGFDGGVVILCAGRFVPYKNHGLLLEVLAELLRKGHPVTLRLAGDGPGLPAARQQAEQLRIGERVRFLGAISNEAVCAEIAQADVYAQLSADRVTEVPGGSYVHAEGMGRRRRQQRRAPGGRDT